MSYTTQDYAQKAAEATSLNKCLYVIHKNNNEILEIKDWDFYVCYDENHTTGELNPNYQEDRQARQRIYLNSLTCTKRVFALMLREIGIEYNSIKALVATDPNAELEWDLCESLKRENPLLDQFAAKLEITPEQLDGLFLFANGKVTKEQFIAGDIELEYDEPTVEPEPEEEEPTKEEEAIEEDTEESIVEDNIEETDKEEQ